MRIALIGYGKMGKAIERVAMSRGHEIVLKIDLDNGFELTPANLSRADVVIEFTGPDSAAGNLLICASAGIPAVCGSTGWLEQYPVVKHAFEENGSAFLYASNFSIGVNIFFELNKKLAGLMAGHPEYSVEMREIHHTRKKTHPVAQPLPLQSRFLQKFHLLKNG